MDDTTAPAGRHEPIWLATSPETDYDALAGGLDVDTAVVGGGIAGITTAATLAAAGQEVALLERDRILTSVTGHTTAKLTSLHGLIYGHLRESFGPEEARLYARANEAAVDEVERTVDEYGIDCDFERRPAYTYLKDDAKRRTVREEVSAARRAGLDASFVEEIELPVEVAGAVRADDQAQFHPRNYLLAQAQRIDAAGSHVFEETAVTGVSGGRTCEIETDRGTVTADAAVLATHFPIEDPAFYYARMHPKRSYVLAAELNEEPPEGMYYYPEKPYFSVRPTPAGEENMVLIGGQNHRTGHGHGTEERYRRLERQARDHFDVASIEYRWSTQDYVSVDKVPFVGPLAPHTRNLYVATGFGGWGMTNGTAAGLLLADLVRGRDNPWADLYRPSRYKLRTSAKPTLEHNKHALLHLAQDKLHSPPALDLASLDRGEARVFDDRDEPVAAYRDEDGEVHTVSAICTHMGCQVSWNDGETSWDCACHGSRFDVDGTVLETPAVADLEALDVGARERASPPAED